MLMQISENNTNFFNHNFISKYYNWNIDYTFQVIYEYEKFMELRFEDSGLSPSDDIDKLWHLHILDTKIYYEYCMKRFGSLVHHNPQDSIDQEARKIRYKNTLIKYIKKFSYPKYEKVWGLKNKNFMQDEKKSDGKNILLSQTFRLPNYYKNKVNDSQMIKIYLLYTFDDGTFLPSGCEKFFKQWKPNNYSFDKKTLTLKIDNHTTIDELKKYISYKTGHNSLAIRIYPHPEYEKIIKHNDNVLNFSKLKLSVFDDENILLHSDKNFKFFIAELIEMSSNGFC